MKTWNVITSATAAGSLLFAAAYAQQDPLTYETPRWLYSAGDFGDTNLDGRIDLALVDKSDGSLTIALQRADGGFDWTAPEPTGFTAPTGLAVGFFNNVSAHQVAVTAPAENRVSIFTPSTAASPLAIRHVYPGAPTTHAIAAFHVDGDGASDLLSGGDQGGTGAHYYWDVLATLHTAPTNLWTSAESVQLHRLWSFRQKSFTPPVAAAIRGTEFYVAAVGASGLLNPRVLAGFGATSGTLMTYGNYDTTALSQVILYSPGQSTARAAKVTEPSANNFAWGPLTTLNFPKPVQVLVTVPSTAGARLAVLYTDTTAATFDFNGTALTTRSNLPGDGYELLAPVGTHGLLSRNSSGAWHRWNVASSNATLSATSSGLIPPASTAQVSNIVFVTGGEPMVNPEAAPVFLGHVRDWTTSAVGGGSNWNVVSLTQGPGGLDNPSSTTYKPVPAATHALVNQYRSNISIHSLEPGAGPRIGNVFISPAEGSYLPLEPGEQFLITFTATDPGALVSYRLSPGAAWSDYDPNAPPAIVGNATVQAYATGPFGRTPTRTAQYTFLTTSALVIGPSNDSDGDGMADEWEKAFAAYDPNGDEDGDNSLNKDEFKNGTDPRDASSFSFTSTFALHATKVGNGPTLTLRLSWPLSDATAILQESATLQLQSWGNITTGITTTATEFVYDVPLTGNIPPARFFRLIRP